LLPVLAALVLLLPAAAPQPTWLSLTAVDRAKEIDFAEGVVWILVLGSDARPGTAVTEGNTDAIQLVGIDVQSGRAAGIGIPRDSYVDLPGIGLDRINAALKEGGADVAAEAVADLVKIEPDYVLVVGMAGFVDMAETVGVVDVHSDTRFYDPEFDLRVQRGTNQFDPEEALSFSRSRRELAGGDFARSANQQQVMLGILKAMRAQEDDEGFIETGALAALGAMTTDLAPNRLYRLAQAVTRVEPGEVTVCVVQGEPDEEFGASIVRVDEAQAARLGRDARDDARLSPGCDG
jgi:LCP family protein required for cell wall assembly